MSQAAVLFVEDEAPFRRFAGGFLEENGFNVTYAGDANQALAAFDAQPSDLVLLDLNLPDLHGLEVLRRLRSRSPGLRVVVLTAYGDAANAVKALKAGATDYLTKPVELDRLLDATRQALDAPSPVAARAAVAASHTEPDAGMVGGHPDWRAALQRLEALVASDPATVLLLGESGAGKTALGRRVHAMGPRRAGPFVEVHCPSVPPALLEGELFGYAAAEGRERKRGQVELADGGTLFLDEVGELPTEVQPKLLRFLEERTFRRVGGEEDRQADLLVVCATHRDLVQAVEAGSLRRDLYYRLEAAQVELPPLRERGDDVVLLAEHLLMRRAAQRQRPPQELTEAARQALREHPFPGNVRELEHVIDRSAALAPDAAQLDAGDLDLGPPEASPLVGPGGGAVLVPLELEAVLDALEAHYVEQAVARSTSQRQAGKLLGIDRFALARRRNRIQRAGGRTAADKVLAAAPAWIRGLLAPHPADLPEEGLDLLGLRVEVESRAIAAALRGTGGNRARAATLLGMSRTSLNRRLEAEGS